MRGNDDADTSAERVETSGQIDGYSFSAEADHIISSIVEAVAWVKGIDPTELEPLYNVVDTAALEEMYRSPPEKRATVTFPYGGCTVRITPDPTITVQPQPTSLAAELDQPSNVLVYDMHTPQYNDEVCSDLLSVESTSEENVLYVTCVSEDNSSTDAWNSYPATQPANLGIVSVGDFTRSASTDSATAQPARGYPQVTTVADPADLGTLGARVDEFLSAWADNNHQTLVCFQALDDLLERGDLTSVFDFLDRLTNRVDATDAAAHYHIDGEQWDDETLATLEPLFETVVEHDQVEGWTSQSG